MANKVAILMSLMSGRPMDGWFIYQAAACDKRGWLIMTSDSVEPVVNKSSGVCDVLCQAMAVVSIWNVTRFIFEIVLIDESTIMMKTCENL